VKYDIDENLIKQFEEKRKAIQNSKLTKKDFLEIYRYLKRELEKKNFDIKQFDILAYLDFSLSKTENLENLKKIFSENYGISFSDDIKSNIEKWQEQEIMFLEKQENEEFEEIKKKVLSSSVDELDGYFKDYENIISILLNSEKKGLIVFGEKGKGKTFNTIRILEKTKKDYELVKGHITSYQLYRKLYENSNRIVVFDDVVGLLNDKDKISILLGALEKLGKVEWITSRNDLDLPRAFNFNGKIIIILNRIDLNNEFQEAIFDRCIPFQFDIPRKTMLEMISILATKRDNIPLEIVEWLHKNKLDITFRDYEMLRDIYRFDKDNWQKIAERILLNEIDKELNYIDKMVYNIEVSYPNANWREKIKQFKDLTGFEKSTYYKHRKKLIRLGLIGDTNV
jgi:hypothetical protein